MIRSVVTWGLKKKKEGQDRGVQRGTRKLLGVMDMFIILIVVIASQGYVKLYSLNTYILLYAYYTSIKLSKNSIGKKGNVALNCTFN